MKQAIFISKDTKGAPQAHKNSCCLKSFIYLSFMDSHDRQTQKWIGSTILHYTIQKKFG